MLQHHLPHVINSSTEDSLEIKTDIFYEGLADVRNRLFPHFGASDGWEEVGLGDGVGWGTMWSWDGVGLDWVMGWGGVRCGLRMGWDEMWSWGGVG